MFFLFQVIYFGDFCNDKYIVVLHIFSNVKENQLTVIFVERKHKLKFALIVISQITRNEWHIVFWYAIGMNEDVAKCPDSKVGGFTIHLKDSEKLFLCSSTFSANSVELKLSKLIAKRLRHFIIILLFLLKYLTE